MKQIIVGTYTCGPEQLKLVLTQENGGSLVSLPGRGEVPRLTVGAYRSWTAVVSVLLHEVMEFTMLRERSRFSLTPDYYPGNHADYLFVMDHQQFDRCVARAADFLAQALPDLATAHKLWHKPKKQSRRKKR